MASHLKPHQERFLNYLFEQSKKEERGVLAVLRRGLSTQPGEDMNMYRYVARFIPEHERGTPKERTYYLIAALYAYHQINVEQGNFGNHMRSAITEINEDATERRFTILLNAHQEDLSDYLRQATSYLKTKEVGINWKQLFEDLLYWGHPESFVQRNWANSFWGYQFDEKK
ncbi:MAG: type I-E CRISPR-associated protein Cse2/CasB [Anaerolineaceae bacterium]|jgi:CRISPR system Cascade subunit CasB|nr:type I-E CRISPR-associated protein Cse2/CasB [Anaerolineaceae bacterium]